MMHAEMSRKALPKDTEETQRARKDHIKALTSDPRFKRLRNSDKRHIRLLLSWHNPLNGYLPYKTPALNLIDRLYMSEEELRLSRWRLIDAGLIVSYVPGSGRTQSVYCIARSWNEAEVAAALRLLPDAPYWPALVDETPSAVDHRGVPAAAAEDIEDQEQEETAEERADAQERLGRARRRGHVRGVVPPELPLPDRGIQRPLVDEIDRRHADIEHQSDTNERGRASLREAYEQTRRVPTASGAA
jgi:hypothetical protein